MSSSEETMLTLKSFDNEEFIIKQSVAVLSVTIKNLIEDGCASTIIPLPNVNSKTLSTVLEYMKKHAECGDDQQLKEFDKNYVMKDMQELFDLVLAANYLNINDLLDIICQKIADDIKDKMPEEIREIFNIKKDFTDEEEAAIRKEHAWAFET